MGRYTQLSSGARELSCLARRDQVAGGGNVSLRFTGRRGEALGVYETVDSVGASVRAQLARTVDTSLDSAMSDTVAGGTPARSGLRAATMALSVGTAGAIIASFLYLVYGYVFSNGLCCGDDAFMAVAAKNLAAGHGYATSLPSPAGSGLHLFDPALSTGPTLVLPATGIIKVFGVTPWAPGLATALVTTALLMLIAFVLGRWVGSIRALWYIAVMLTLMYTLTAGSRFANWYSLLGEVPAAMLTVLGVALFVWRPGKRRAHGGLGLPRAGARIHDQDPRAAECGSSGDLVPGPPGTK